ncbi:hypothetical protein FRC01_008722, partial [Tulasnella sp. 417]
MFGKILRKRSAAASSSAPAVQSQSGPHAQSASRKPSLVKKLLHVKNVFKRSHSVKNDADFEIASHRRKGVPSASQPAQGPSALTHGGLAGFDQCPNLSLPIETAQSPASIDLPPRAQAWWQGATAPTSAQSNLSANLASPQLPSPQPVFAAPAAPFAPTRSNLQQRPAQSAAHRGPTSLDVPSHLASPQPVLTTPAAPFTPTRSTSQQQPTQYAAYRSTTLLNLPSPLASQPPVATTP